MDVVFRVREWLADHAPWFQYPKPRVRNHNGYHTGLKLRWQMRKPMNRWLALILPTALLFLPWVGVYLSIGSVIFLFAYFSRRW